MRKRKQNKAQHYQLSWNVFNAVEIVEQYEKQSGDTTGQLPLPVLMKIHQGSLLTALQFGTIPNHQTYGVTFFAKIKKDSGEEGIVERGFRIDTPMKLSEFINGYSDCYVNKGHGLKTKGWKGAKEEWLSMMDEEFKSDTCLDAWAVANCLHKGNVAKTMTRRYKEAV